MNFLAFLVVGLFAGWIASVLVHGRGAGMIRDVIIGVIGALIGGFVFQLFDINVYGFWGALATSAVGATVFLFVVQIFSKPKNP